MKTNEFKRAVGKTFHPKATKEAIRTFLRKQRSVNLLQSVVNLSCSTGRLEHALQGYVLGHQLNSDMKAAARTYLGEVAHHGVAVAKLLKAKVPPSQRKIKPKNTPTFLLTQIGYLSSNALYRIADVSERTTVHKLTSAELAQAKASGIRVKPIQIHAPPLNAEALEADVVGLLNAVFEFSWALYQEPIANVMGEYVERLKASYPPGVFDPPAPRPVKGAAAKKALAKKGAKAPAKNHKAAV